MSIAIFDIPIPCVVIEDGREIEAYAIYVESGGMFENDLLTCAHCEGGIVRHYTTDKVRMYKNSTYGINKDESR